MKITMICLAAAAYPCSALAAGNHSLTAYYIYFVGRESFASDHAVNKTIENKSSTGAAFNSSLVKDWDASRAAVIAGDECKDDYSSDSTITKQSANTVGVS